MKFAARAAAISASPTISVMQQARALRAQGIDVIDLGPGEPDFDTPATVSQAGVDAINAGYTRYTPSSGSAELREAVAAKLNAQWGTDFTAANVIMTAGAKAGIYTLCAVALERGDEAIVPAPYWVTFPEVVRMAEAEPVIVETCAADGFELDPAVVERALTDSTRCLILNTPNNPTGAVMSRETVSELNRLAREHNFLILFDETYEYLTYEGREHTSLASLVSGEDSHFAIAGSFSKTYAMTGWRVGYCVGHRDLIAKMGEFQSHQCGNPTSISQKAALAALAAGTGSVDEMKSEYTSRRRLVLEEIETLPGVSCQPPYGAFYAFPDVSEAMDLMGISTSVEFSKMLIEKARVATVPGSAFGLQGHIRLSYATSVENLQEAFSRMRSVLEGATQPTP